MVGIADPGGVAPKAVVHDATSTLLLPLLGGHSDGLLNLEAPVFIPRGIAAPGACGQIVGDHMAVIALPALREQAISEGGALFLTGGIACSSIPTLGVFAGIIPIVPVGPCAPVAPIAPITRAITRTVVVGVVIGHGVGRNEG